MKNETREQNRARRDRQRRKDAKLHELLGFEVVVLRGYWDPECGEFSPNMPDGIISIENVPAEWDVNDRDGYDGVEFCTKNTISNWWKECPHYCTDKNEFTFVLEQAKQLNKIQSIIDIVHSKYTLEEIWFLSPEELVDIVISVLQ